MPESNETDRKRDDSARVPEHKMFFEPTMDAEAIARMLIEDYERRARKALREKP